MYPQRPGMPTCAYFMKTGKCHYSSRCRFHHPARDKRLLASLSRRDCFDFIQTGTCAYGADCKYNHPQLSPRPDSNASPELQIQAHQHPNEPLNGHVHPTLVKSLPVPSPTNCFQLENRTSPYERNFSFSPISNNPVHHHHHQHHRVPTFARSEGACSSVSWSTSIQGEDPIDIDPIAVLREGLRPREWDPSFSPTSPANVPTPTRAAVASTPPKGTTGFDPLGYDTQIFGALNIWATTPSVTSFTR